MVTQALGISKLLFGVPTDDTCRVRVSNISTKHFFKVTVGILLRTVYGIIGLTGDLGRGVALLHIQHREDAKEFESATRRHWEVENRLYWQMGFMFRDDKNTSMARNGAKNSQTMKKMVLLSWH